MKNITARMIKLETVSKAGDEIYICKEREEARVRMMFIVHTSKNHYSEPIYMDVHNFLDVVNLKRLMNYGGIIIEDVHNIAKEIRQVIGEIPEVASMAKLESKHIYRIILETLENDERIDKKSKCHYIENEILEEILEESGVAPQVFKKKMIMNGIIKRNMEQGRMTVRKRLSRNDEGAGERAGKLIRAVYIDIEALREEIE